MTCIRAVRNQRRVCTCPGLEDILCGAFRPGHFMGVATVVAKLMNMVQPDVALFGEKDYQQLMIIRRAAIDLCMPVEIIGVPTTRETDGLAMSSRNRYLSPEQRRLSPHIFAQLEDARRAIESGDRDFARIEAKGMQALQSAGFKPDYFEIRDATTLARPSEASSESGGSHGGSDGPRAPDRQRQSDAASVTLSAAAHAAPAPIRRVPAPSRMHVRASPATR